MAYYIKGEASETYMSFINLPNAFVNEKQHQSIMDNKNLFMDVANKYTVDCEASREKGIEVNAPKIEFVTIGCQIIHGGEDLSLCELKNQTYVMYWLNCHAKNPQAISSHESYRIEPELKELFYKLIEE